MMTVGTTTISEALLIGNNKLKKITNNYHNETFWLLGKSLNKNTNDLLLNKNHLMNIKQFDLFISLIERRISNEPLQLILESISFYNYKFSTYKNVFIARPETELFIDILKNYNRSFDSTLEVGCGLGCLSITLALEKLTQDILAIDINAEAISASKENAKKLNCNNINFINGNIFSIKHNTKYDLIISNPPYISINEIQDLDLNVLLYDPLLSLTDFNDGLNFYRYFAKFGQTLLKDNGLMLFEFGGEHQKSALEIIFNNQNYELSFFNDLNNMPRFVSVELCN